MECVCDNKRFRRHCDDEEPAVPKENNKNGTIWIENTTYQTENANTQDEVPRAAEVPGLAIVSKAAEQRELAPGDVAEQQKNDGRRTTKI